MRNKAQSKKIFDFCYQTDVIHHIPDLLSMFRELFRVLKTSGLLCVVTESHSQIDARLFNRDFPSLAGNEKRRYPNLGEISDRAGEVGLCGTGNEAVSSPACCIPGDFSGNVAEKNWSMVRLISEVEFSSGLPALLRDQWRTFESAAAGETLLWFRKRARSGDELGAAEPR